VSAPACENCLHSLTWFGQKCSAHRERCTCGGVRRIQQMNPIVWVCENGCDEKQPPRCLTPWICNWGHAADCLAKGAR